MKTFLTLFLISFIFIGCSKQKPTNEYSSKEFPGVNKDALLNAAKKVIKLSDSNFEIESKRTSLKALKISPIHQGFTVDINVNTIEMLVFEDDNTTIGKVKFTHKKDVNQENEKVVHGEIHNLYWGRIAYILGKDTHWKTCADHRGYLNFDGILCDLIHNEDTPPKESDIIVNTGFDTNKPIFKKEIKLADIDLSSLQAVELPFSKKSDDTPIQEEQTPAIEESIQIEEPAEEDLVLEVELEDSNSTLLDESVEVTFDEKETKED